MNVSCHLFYFGDFFLIMRTLLFLYGANISCLGLGVGILLWCSGCPFRFLFLVLFFIFHIELFNRFQTHPVVHLVSLCSEHFDLFHLLLCFGDLLERRLLELSSYVIDFGRQFSFLL